MFKCKCKVHKLFIYSFSTKTQTFPIEHKAQKKFYSQFFPEFSELQSYEYWTMHISKIPVEKQTFLSGNIDFRPYLRGFLCSYYCNSAVIGRNIFH